MKIGIDIDGVILNSEQEFNVAAELYETKKLKQNTLRDRTAMTIEEKYNWTEEQKNYFFKNQLVECSKKCDFMPGAVEILNLLKEEGNELIIITARGWKNNEMKTIAEERLLEKGLEFDEYYWGCKNKIPACKEAKIDIMIDDLYTNCEQISNENIKTLYFRAAGVKSLNENEYLKEVHNWGEIYRFINEEKNKQGGI